MHNHVVGPIEQRKSSQQVSDGERALEIQLGRLGGIELRPTRLFVWSGEERDRGARIVHLGGRPQSLDLQRSVREVEAGSLHIRTVGNPLMTVALAGARAARTYVQSRRSS